MKFRKTASVCIATFYSLTYTGGNVWETMDCTTKFGGFLQIFALTKWQVNKSLHNFCPRNPFSHTNNIPKMSDIKGLQHVPWHFAGTWSLGPKSAVLLCSVAQQPDFLRTWLRKAATKKTGKVLIQKTYQPAQTRILKHRLYKMLCRNFLSIKCPGCSTNSSS